MDRPPRFGQPGEPRPPKVIVFDLVETEAFVDGWFSPDAHVEATGAGAPGDR